MTGGPDLSPRMTVGFDAVPPGIGRVTPAACRDPRIIRQEFVIFPRLHYERVPTSQAGNSLVDGAARRPGVLRLSARDAVGPCRRHIEGRGVCRETPHASRRTAMTRDSMGLDMPGLQERTPQGEFADATAGFWRGCRRLCPHQDRCRPDERIALDVPQQIDMSAPHQCHDAVPGGGVLPIWFVCWMRDIPALHGGIMSIHPSIICALPLMPIAVFLNGQMRAVSSSAWISSKIIRFSLLRL